MPIGSKAGSTVLDYCPQKASQRDPPTRRQLVHIPSTESAGLVTGDAARGDVALSKPNPQLFLCR